MAEIGVWKNTFIDYYSLFGIRKKATDNEIKTAYRKLAMKYHPDRNRDKPKNIQEKCEEMFKKITLVYDILRDDQKRSSYDNLHINRAPANNIDYFCVPNNPFYDNFSQISSQSSNPNFQPNSNNGYTNSPKPNPNNANPNQNNANPKPNNNYNNFNANQDEQELGDLEKIILNISNINGTINFKLNKDKKIKINAYAKNKVKNGKTMIYSVNVKNNDAIISIPYNITSMMDPANFIIKVNNYNGGKISGSVPYINELKSDSGEIDLKFILPIPIEVKLNTNVESNNYRQVKSANCLTFVPLYADYFKGRMFFDLNNSKAKVEYKKL
jgi:curved DNA-binding protein CbpA